MPLLMVLCEHPLHSQSLLGSAKKPVHNQNYCALPTLSTTFKSCKWYVSTKQGRLSTPWEVLLLFTLPSMTATQELVVPRSIPMISLPTDAWMAALALHGNIAGSNLVWHLRLTVTHVRVHRDSADLNALRSKGPVLRGRDASDNCIKA